MITAKQKIKFWQRNYLRPQAIQKERIFLTNVKKTRHFRMIKAVVVF